MQSEWDAKILIKKSIIDKEKKISISIAQSENHDTNQLRTVVVLSRESRLFSVSLSTDTASSLQNQIKWEF